MTTVPDVCSPRATGLRARSGWRAGRPGRLPSSPAAGGEGQLRGTSRGDTGKRTGRRWRVGSREKWLYFSYTPYIIPFLASETRQDGQL